MKDANNYLLDNPIEILTSISDDCPYRKCDGTGQIWKKDWSRLNKKDEIDENGKLLRAEWIERCECYEQLMKQREIDKKIDLSNIPPIFAKATVSSYRIEKYKSQESRDIASLAKKAAANYIFNFNQIRESGKGLYFYSEVKGSGKTRLASSIANALVKEYGVNLAFIKTGDLIEQVKKAMFDKNSKTTKAEIIQMFREVDLLVIDDIALKGATEFEEDVMYDIVDYRLEHKNPTIFTSNVTIMELENIYPGGRVNQRIDKMALEVYMPEESIRVQEAEAEDAELERILFG